MLVVFGQQPTAAENEARAREVLEAYRAGDEDELRRLGDRRIPDAFQVAKHLLWIHLDEPRGDALEAAAAFARAAGSCEVVWEPLPELVESWSRFGAGELERERRLRDRLLRMRAVGESSWEEVLRLGDEAAEDLIQPRSLTACELVFVHSSALWTFARHLEAGAGFRRAAEMAGGLGWKGMQAMALQHAAHQDHTRRARAEAAATYQEELAVREELGETVRAAQVCVILGGLLADIERLDEAQTYLERAAVEMGEIGDLFGVGMSHQRLAKIHGLRSRLPEAIESERLALAAYREAHHREGVGRALANIGLFARRLGDLELARDHLERGVAELEAVGDAWDAGRALQNLGLLWSSLGETARALEILERSRARSAAASDARVAAHTLTLIADCQRRLGRYAAALESGETALAELEPLGDPRGVAQALASLASTDRVLQRRELALERYRSAHEVQEELGARGPAAETLAVIADVLGELGRPDEALEAYRRSSAALAELGIRARAALVRSRMALALQVAGRGDEALEIARSSREELLELGASRDAALALRWLAEIQEREGRSDDALASHRRAQAEGRLLRDGVLELDSLASIGAIRHQRGAHREALADARRAARLRGRLSEGLAEEEALGLRGSELADVHLGTACIASLLAAGPEDADELRSEAFRLFEVGRARLLAEGLVERETLLEARLPPEVYELESNARHRVRGLQQRIARLAAGSEPELDALASAAEELDGAYAELQEARALAQRESRRATDLVRAEPIAAAAFRRRLGSGEGFVAYETSPHRLRALVVTAGSIELFDLGDARDLAQRVELFLRLAGTPGGDDRAVAAELYDRLLGPLQRELAPKRRLLVSPDGPLTFLPFDALLDGESNERAIERWEIVLVPSATVFESLAKDAGESERPDVLLALGDPLYPGEQRAGGMLVASRGAALRGLADLRRLPGSGAEVASIAELFEGDQRLTLTRERASIDGLLEHLDFLEGGGGVLHLACHGHLDAERPRLSGLVLAGGQVLSVADVYDLSLDADLVVLSACETGRGELVRGEGAIGLVRGFLFAGASRVIVSNWKVNDASASSLMLAFYRGMMEEELTPGEALRGAKLEHLASEGPRSHPHHWAAFVLWGLP